MHVHAAPAGHGKTTRVLWFSMLATLAYVALTLVAGLRAHSLALMSEAGHTMPDFLALALSFVAVCFLPAPPHRPEHRRLAARCSAGGIPQRGNAGRHLALDRRRSPGPAEPNRNCTA